MAFKELSLDELAATLGVDVDEVREKHRLIKLIKKARKERKVSQPSWQKN